MNPTILCLTETVSKLAYYAVVAYAIYSGRTVLIAFITRRADLNDLFAPRTPEEQTIDNARRLGHPIPAEDEAALEEFPEESDEVKVTH